MRFSLSEQNHRSIRSTIGHALIYLLEHWPDDADENDLYPMLRLLIDAAELMSEAIPHDQELESDDPFMQDRETERERIADQKLDDAESEAAAERDTPHEFVRPGMTNMVDDFAKRTAHAATGPTLTMIEKRQNLIDILEASNEADRKQ